MRNNRLWILGAGDPEMEAIENLLRSAGENIAYAMNDGKRVHPGNAYKGEINTWPSAAEIFLVECDVPAIHDRKGTCIDAPFCGCIDCSHVPVSITVIDHHRPGDPGYGVKASYFLTASSVGQVLLALTAITFGKKLSEMAIASLGSEKSTKWWVTTSYDPEVILRQIDPNGSDRDLFFSAAADHCLPAAYRGECDGVDPDALMKWRIESRAKFQGRSPESVLKDIEVARKALREASCYAGIIGRVADFRSLGTVPELPEAAAREGIAFLAEVVERDGRRKIVLQAADEHQVAEFLATYPVTDKYGDPARGFAGGYLE